MLFPLRPSAPHTLAWIGSVAATYFLAARVGLSLAVQPEGIAPVWLPEGVLLSAILLTRSDRRPLLVAVLWAVDLAAELLAGISPALSAVYSTALMTDAVLASWLLIRFTGEPVDFTKTRHVAGLLVFSTILGNGVAGAMAAAGTVFFAGSGFLTALAAWTLPDAIGALVVAPFVLSFAPVLAGKQQRWNAAAAFEGAILVASLALVTVLALRHVTHSGLLSFLLVYGTFPFMLWAGLRLGIRGVTSALMTLAAVTVAYAAADRLPHLQFYGYEFPTVTAAQLYLVILALPSLFLGAAVTERKDAGEVLLAKEARLAKAEEIAHVGSWDLDVRTGDIHWSDEVYRMFGFEPQSFGATYEAFLEAVHPDDREAVEAAYQGSLHEDGDSYEIEHRIVRKSTGEVRHVYEKCEHERDASGRIVRSIGMVHDVTARKQAERALTKMRQMDDEALQVARMGHWEFDVASGAFTFNDRYYQLHAITAAQAGGYQMSAEKFARTYVHPDYAHTVQEAIDQAKAAEGPDFRTEFESCILRGDGEPRFVTVWFRAEKDATGVTTKLYGVNQDVTERRRAEHALGERNHYIETILESSPIGFAVNTIHDGKAVFVAGRFEEIYGVPRGSVRTADEHFEKVYRDPALREQIRARIMADMASGDAARMRWEDIPLTLASGEKRFVTAINIPLLDQNLMVSTVQDVTARHLAEAALRESETRFRTLVDQAGDGFELLDEDGRFVDVNAADCRQLGYSREELLRMSIFDVDPLVSPEEYRRGFQDMVGKPPWTRESVHRRKDGTTFPVEFTTSVIRMGDACRALTVVRDISERKKAEQERHKLEEQLVQAQKMESVGRLAGGIAHDFNNMLSVILGNTELMLADAPLPAEGRATLTEIQDAARRSAELTRQLLAFARRQTIEPVSLDLNDAMTGMLKMLRRIIGEQIDLVFRPGAGLWTVRMDPAQLDQVLANLCVNARDAITGVGRVTIETQNVTLDEAYCAQHAGLSPGQHVMLAVSDDGAGISREVMDHLFEPFFTTKDVGRGTGLGLATVYGVVRQNGGSINVYSEPGHGTIFKIYLPRCGDQAAMDAALPPAATPPRGRETILLVEDEPMNLRLVAQMLEALGYVVLRAGTPADALDLAASHPGPIDVLITDVVMPAMGGKELSRKLASLRPEAPVLFTSGYAAEVITQNGVLERGVHFLQKPFSIATLAERVRAVLERR